MIKSLIKNLIYYFLSSFIVRRGSQESVYLTFDDGPHPENTLKILNVLSTYDVHAIFFMTGTEMEKYPQIVHNVINRGHKVAYHGYTHASMRKQTYSEFKFEMTKKDTLEDLFNIKLSLYRPPFGDLSVFGFIILVLNRCKIIMWSTDSRDSFDSEEQILDTLSVKNIKPGDILLFHDDYPKTVCVLDKLLSEYNNAKIKLSTDLF